MRTSTGCCDVIVTTKTHVAHFLDADPLLLPRCLATRVAGVVAMVLVGGGGRGEYGAYLVLLDDRVADLHGDGAVLGPLQHLWVMFVDKHIIIIQYSENI